MGRRDRTVAVNEVRHSAGGAGWPAALTPAPQRGATFKKVAAHAHQFSTRILCARAHFFLEIPSSDLINFLAPIFESATHTYMVKHVCNEVALWNSLWNLPIEDHLKKSYFNV